MSLTMAAYTYVKTTPLPTPYFFAVNVHQSTNSIHWYNISDLVK